jgi:hypothetical protein
MKFLILKFCRAQVAVAIWLVLGLAVPVSAANPDRPGREFIEMFWMIVTKGADMGPTDGWFHPSQSRYGWDWLKARDKDDNGSISPEELRAPAELFRRLDRNRDGAIKPDDLDWSPQSAYLRQQAAARRRFTMMDSNSNGKISKEEWDAFFARAAKDKGALTLEDLSDALDPPPPAPPKDKAGKSKPPVSAGPSRRTLLAGLFTGELGSRFEGPRVGDVAPDFTLKTHDGKGEFTLSKLRGEKPVVLVFGSFT